MVTALYEAFLQERRFLKNCSPKTIRSYRQAWDSFESVIVPVKKTEEVRAAVKAGAVEMMNAGKPQPPDPGGVRSAIGIPYWIGIVTVVLARPALVITIGTAAPVGAFCGMVALI